MFDKLKKTITEQASQIKDAALEHANHLKDATLEQAVQLSDVAKDKTKETAISIVETIKEKTSNMTDAIKEKTFNYIDDWLKIFPNLENYGLNITSFGISMSISPVLEVELCGEAEDFSVEKLDIILDEVKENHALTTVFKTVRMTYAWQKRTGSECYFDKIFLKLSIGISPQVMVYLGEPKLM